MLVLLIILVPLAALLIGAIVFELRHRRRGALGSHDIDSAVRKAGANWAGKGLGRGPGI